ncbi:hypothetical protein [Kitasatospora phosalacinea]|uniref:hypothetical protein n=1 Tax=Kitasatospora phosalacinea TaxID=2065 RepID=UPI000524CE7B|nr:hypothetical protein [Kitasatospora phosalacinea]
MSDWLVYESGEWTALAGRSALPGSEQALAPMAATGRSARMSHPKLRSSSNRFSSRAVAWKLLVTVQ